MTSEAPDDHIPEGNIQPDSTTSSKIQHSNERHNFSLQVKQQENAVNKIGCVVKETDCIVKETGRVSKETECVKKTDCVVQETDCVVEETSRVTQETDCVVKDTGRVTQETDCVVKDTGCVVKEAGCVVKETDGVVKETGCVVKEIGRVVKETGCVVKEIGRVVKETVELKRPLSDSGYSSSSSDTASPPGFTDHMTYRSPAVSKLGDKIKVERKCHVCGEVAHGNFFGAVVCLPCKTFFIRCTTEDQSNFMCRQGDDKCNVTGINRSRCKSCRYQKCLNHGMNRKERPEQVVVQQGQQLCKVCADVANGVHFGVISCEGCKKFFRRGLRESASYMCKVRGFCLINPRTRNDCRYCRFQKCITAGMSTTAIKMGRPRKSLPEQLYPLSTDIIEDRSKSEPTSPLNSLRMSGPISPLNSLNMCEPISPFIKVSLSEPTNPLNKVSLSKPTSPLNKVSLSKPTSPLKNTRIEVYSTLTSPRLNTRDSICNHSEMYKNVHPWQADKHVAYGHDKLTQSSTYRPTLKFSVPKCGPFSKYDYQNHGACRSTFSEELFEAAAHRQDRKRTPPKSQEPHHPSVTRKHALDTPMSPLFQAIHHADRPPPLKRIRQEECEGIGERHCDTDAQSSSCLQHMRDSILIDCSKIKQEVAYQRDRSDYQSSHNGNDSAQQMSLPSCRVSMKEDSLPYCAAPVKVEHCDESCAVSVTERHKSLLQHEFDENYWRLKVKDRENPAMCESQLHLVTNLASAYLELVESFCRNQAIIQKGEDGESQQRFIHYITAVICFMRNVPGFCKLHDSDKYTILRLGAIQVCAVVASVHLYNPVQHTYIKSFFEQTLDDTHPSYHFRSALLQLSRQLHSLNLDNMESAFFCALLSMAADWPNLKMAEEITRVRSDLMSTFTSYINIKYGKQSDRVDKMFSLVSTLRKLGVWHYRMSFEGSLE